MKPFPSALGFGLNGGGGMGGIRAVRKRSTLGQSLATSTAKVKNLASDAMQLASLRDGYIQRSQFTDPILAEEWKNGDWFGWPAALGAIAATQRILCVATGLSLVQFIFTLSSYLTSEARYGELNTSAVEDAYMIATVLSGVALWVVVVGALMQWVHGRYCQQLQIASYDHIPNSISVVPNTPTPSCRPVAVDHASAALHATNGTTASTPPAAAEEHHLNVLSAENAIAPGRIRPFPWGSTLLFIMLIVHLVLFTFANFVSNYDAATPSAHGMGLMLLLPWTIQAFGYGLTLRVLGFNWLILYHGVASGLALILAWVFAPDQTSFEPASARVLFSCLYILSFAALCYGEWTRLWSHYSIFHLAHVAGSSVQNMLDMYYRDTFALRLIQSGAAESTDFALPQNATNQGSTALGHAENTALADAGLAVVGRVGASTSTSKTLTRSATVASNLSASTFAAYGVDSSSAEGSLTTQMERILELANGISRKIYHAGETANPLWRSVIEDLAELMEAMKESADWTKTKFVPKTDESDDIRRWFQTMTSDTAATSSFLSGGGAYEGHGSSAGGHRASTSTAGPHQSHAAHQAGQGDQTANSKAGTGAATSGTSDQMVSTRGSVSQKRPGSQVARGLVGAPGRRNSIAVAVAHAGGPDSFLPNCSLGVEAEGDGDGDGDESDIAEEGEGEGEDDDSKAASSDVTSKREGTQQSEQTSVSDAVVITLDDDTPDAPEVLKQRPSESVSVDGSARPAGRTGTRGGRKARSRPLTLAEELHKRFLPSADLRSLNHLVDQFDDWNFNVFDLEEVTHDHPVLFVGGALFQRYGLVSRFKIDAAKLQNFLIAVESGYNHLPYHNKFHAADVARSMHYFLHITNTIGCFTDLERLAFVVAGLVHDINHGGLTNLFLIRKRHHLALLYNDRSVLENHHAAAAFLMLQQPHNNILENLTNDEYDQFRKLVIELVLITDLKQHFDFIGKFKYTRLTHEPLQFVEQPEARHEILKMAIKCSDVGHSVKELQQHIRWSHRVQEEFYRQGDAEKASGLEVSPFCDRDTPNLPKSQVGFFEYIIQPMFRVWCEFFAPDLQEIEMNLEQNMQYWLRQNEPAAVKEDNRVVHDEAPPASDSTTEVKKPSA